jgi:imidazolonepropionase-like amidohydrolase
MGRLGALADVLLVDDDPLQDLSLLAGLGEALTLVMRSGVVFHRSDV